jgi:hypothetical protein
MHNALSPEYIKMILQHLNPGLSDEFTMDEPIEQIDRSGNDKGRIFPISAGAEFLTYVKTRHYKLEFSGGPVPCETHEEKVRVQAMKKRARDMAGGKPMGPPPASGSGSGSAAGRPSTSGQKMAPGGRIPKLPRH